MNVYIVEGKSGEEVAFEIENVYLSVKRISKILQSVDEVSDIRLKKLFERSEYLVTFKYYDEEYVVWEPFGDSSRYWIGPLLPESSKLKNTKLKEVFINYRPNFLVQFVGSIISLEIFKKA